MDGIKTKVLLVDDEESFVSALEKRLSFRDIEVLTAFNGRQALDTLDSVSDVDIVLLDVKMPGMDGIDTLREIKKAHPLVEVIMLTGHASVEAAIEGMKIGAFDFLMKPCDVEEILAKVEEAKTKRRVHQAKIIAATGKELRAQRAR